MVSDILADRHRAKVKQALADHANGVVTERTYTQSDMEALRERCAKEIEDCHEGGHCGEGTFDIIKRQRFNSVLKQAAAIIRSVPLTPHTEEEVPAPSEDGGK